MQRMKIITINGQAHEVRHWDEAIRLFAFRIDRVVNSLYLTVDGRKVNHSYNAEQWTPREAVIDFVCNYITQYLPHVKVYSAMR